jgi:hypothetical protein
MSARHQHRADGVFINTIRLGSKLEGKTHTVNTINHTSRDVTCLIPLFRFCYRIYRYLCLSITQKTKYLKLIHHSIPQAYRRIKSRIKPIGIPILVEPTIA